MTTNTVTLDDGIIYLELRKFHPSTATNIYRRIWQRKGFSNKSKIIKALKKMDSLGIICGLEKNGETYYELIVDFDVTRWIFPSILTKHIEEWEKVLAKLPVKADKVWYNRLEGLKKQRDTFLPLSADAKELRVRPENIRRIEHGAQFVDLYSKKRKEKYGDLIEEQLKAKKPDPNIIKFGKENRLPAISLLEKALELLDKFSKKYKLFAEPDGFNKYSAEYQKFWTAYQLVQIEIRDKRYATKKQVP